MNDILSNEFVGIILMAILVPLGFIGFFLVANVLAKLINSIIELGDSHP